MALRVGNAPCSWGTLEFEDTKGEQIPFNVMLDELADTGYTGTELGDLGYMPTDASRLEAELARRKLVMLGGFVPVALRDPAASEAGLATVLRVARLLSAVASDPPPYLVLSDNNGSLPQRTREAGRITPEMGLNEDEWNTFARNANALARAVKDTTGLRTVFHHHCAGYVETPDEMERFLALTGPDLVGLVFDTGHYTYGSGGLHVLDGLERFGDRIWYVHLKDCSSEVAARGKTEHWDYFDALRHGIFCELGRGVVDFPAVLKWLNDKPYNGYVVVEQDMLPGMGTAKESAVRNRAYLESIGLRTA
jgi:inosose dehydratase